MLDLYQGTWEGKPLGKNDYVISADEKTSIQARKRIIPAVPSKPHCLRRVEFEYQRKGALAYLAAWDIKRAKIMGLCQKKTGIESFHLLVDLVMTQEPYRSANRVFWVVDNGSSHQGESSIKRLFQWYKKLSWFILLYMPVGLIKLKYISLSFNVKF